jgi:hypothetical protein
MKITTFAAATVAVWVAVVNISPLQASVIVQRVVVPDVFKPAYVQNVTTKVKRVDDPPLEYARVSEEKFNRYVNKGCNLVKAMAATDAEAATFFVGMEGSAESKFKDFGKINKTALGNCLPIL